MPAQAVLVCENETEKVLLEEKVINQEVAKYLTYAQLFE
jgi:hypothetical protein